MNEELEKVRIIFKKPKEEEVTAAGISELPEVLASTVDDLLEWFKKFEIESIEIWVEAAAKTGKVIDLFVAAEGKGGVKITLKPTY